MWQAFELTEASRMNMLQFLSEFERSYALLILGTLHITKFFCAFMKFSLPQKFLLWQRVENSSDGMKHTNCLVIFFVPC